MWMATEELIDKEENARTFREIETMVRI